MTPEHNDVLVDDNYCVSKMTNVLKQIRQFHISKNFEVSILFGGLKLNGVRQRKKYKYVQKHRSDK